MHVPLDPTTPWTVWKRKRVAWAQIFEFVERCHFFGESCYRLLRKKGSRCIRSFNQDSTLAIVTDHSSEIPSIDQERTHPGHPFNKPPHMGSSASKSAASGAKSAARHFPSAANIAAQERAAAAAASAARAARESAAGGVGDFERKERKEKLTSSPKLDYLAEQRKLEEQIAKYDEAIQKSKHLGKDNNNKKHQKETTEQGNSTRKAKVD